MSNNGKRKCKYFGSLLSFIIVCLFFRNLAIIQPNPSLYSSSSEQMPSHSALHNCLIFWNFLSSNQTTYWRTDRIGEMLGKVSSQSQLANRCTNTHSNSVTRVQHYCGYLQHACTRTNMQTHMLRISCLRVNHTHEIIGRDIWDKQRVGQSEIYVVDVWDNRLRLKAKLLQMYKTQSTFSIICLMSAPKMQ